MLSSTQLFSVLSITLVVLAVHFVNGFPVNSDATDEINSPEQNNFINNELQLFKRKLPLEGILIGRRSFPEEGILIGRRSFPEEGILIGRRSSSDEDVLFGKDDYPTEGIMIGKRNFRLFPPKSMAYNRFQN